MKPLLPRRPLAAAVSASLLLLAGCTVGPDYERPASPLPEQFRAADASTERHPVAVQKDWWTLFADPALDELVATALRHNSDLQLAAARLEESEALADQARAARFPQVDLGASETRSRSSTTNTASSSTVPAVQDKKRATLGTSFELDFWGKLRRASEAARAGAAASEYARDAMALSVAAGVTQAYLNLRSLDAQLEASRNTLDSRSKALGIAYARHGSGLVSELDLNQAAMSQAAAAVQTQDLQQQRALAEHQLQLLTGRMDLPPTPGNPDSLPLPPLPPAGLPSSLLESRPDLRQAEAQLVAANARIGVARAALFPTISLTGLFGGESAQLSQLFSGASKIWSAGFGLTLPIFDAGRLRAAEHQATAQQQQALINYQKAVQTAFKEVNDALVNLRQTGAKAADLDRQSRAAQRSLKLAESRYQAGYSPFLDVLDAQRNTNEVSLSLIRNHQARLAASVDLFRALGGGWQAPTEP
ncbi:MAG: outer membrane protein multidrug efflux system [Pseudomonadota bacterium]